jgi:hypothetical protein
MEKETLKSLRAKAKDLRSKVSSAPLSKATPDQLKSEILMLERAVKADEKAKEKKALKEQSVKAVEKKKITTAVPVVKAKPKSDDREKELARREKELLKREKMLLKPKPDLRAEMSDTDDSDYC